MFPLLGTMLALGSPEESVPLATQLLQDGHHDRARSVLESVDPETLGEFAGRYHTASGVLALAETRYADAREAFTTASEFVASGQEGPAVESLQLYVAQCSVSLQEFAVALYDLQTASNDLPAYWLLKSAAHEGLDDAEAFFLTVAEGRTLFNDNLELAKTEIKAHLWLGVHQQSLNQAMSLIERSDLDVVDCLHVAREFQESGAPEGAYRVLKQCSYRFSDTDLWVAAAAQAIALERYPDAAALLIVLAEKDPSFAIEASEAYRQAGVIRSALYANSLASDGPEKVRQRLGLYVTKGQFVEAVSLVPRLKRWDLMSDDAVRYGVAYAYFQLGSYENAKESLLGIQDAIVFKQAAALRRAIASCEIEHCR